jgi:hypothetical protein
MLRSKSQGMRLAGQIQEATTEERNKGYSTTPLPELTP